jgi:cytosine/adenosine deaminase-related metal-dependent hydrolase
MTARQALELGTLGGASLLGRDDIGSLAVGKRCDFFALDLNALGYAGGLSDPVAATMFCAPQSSRYTIVDGKPVVWEGKVITLDLPKVIHEHNKHAARLAEVASF